MNKSGFLSTDIIGNSLADNGLIESKEQHKPGEEQKTNSEEIPQGIKKPEEPLTLVTKILTSISEIIMDPQLKDRVEEQNPYREIIAHTIPRLFFAWKIDKLTDPKCTKLLELMLREQLKYYKKLGLDKESLITNAFESKIENLEKYNKGHEVSKRGHGDMEDQHKGFSGPEEEKSPAIDGNNNEVGNALKRVKDNDNDPYKKLETSDEMVNRMKAVTPITVTNTNASFHPTSTPSKPTSPREKG